MSARMQHRVATIVILGSTIVWTAAVRILHLAVLMHVTQNGPSVVLFVSGALLEIHNVPATVTVRNLSCVGMEGVYIREDHDFVCKTKT